MQFLFALHLQILLHLPPMVHSDTLARLGRRLVIDILPPRSQACSVQSSETSYTFEFQKNPRNEWDPTAIDLEEKVFLLEMAHNDTNENKTWSLRLGTGGNMYSFLGVFGESVAPQFHSNGEFVDEVWQNVAVSEPKNLPEERFFIHQAGTYQRDDRATPYYSPSVAHFCRTGECFVASWGQQAHLPTSHQNSVLYMSRYRDCGDGVLEISSAIHNMASTSSETLTFVSAPWGGVRRSLFPEILMSHSDRPSTLVTNYRGFSNNEAQTPAQSGGFYSFLGGDQHPHAVSMVYGSYGLDPIDRRLGTIRFGTGGSVRRDYIAFEVANHINMLPGQTLSSRQYMIIDQGDSIEETSRVWEAETLRTSEVSQGRRASLYRSGSRVAVRSVNGNCSKAKFFCNGYTIPREGTQAVWWVACGETEYIGVDPYYFAPSNITVGDMSDVRRPWHCNGLKGIEPKVALLGFYEVDGCSDILENTSLRFQEACPK